MTLRALMIALVTGLLLIALVLSVLSVTATRQIASREPDSGGALPPNVPGRLVRVGGHHVHVVERGEGPAILLVHGTGGTTLDWETSVLDDLAKDHRVIALDLFGMGFSDRDDNFAYGFTLWADQLADQLAGTLDALGVERAVCNQYEPRILLPAWRSENLVLECGDRSIDGPMHALRAPLCRLTSPARDDAPERTTTSPPRVPGRGCRPLVGHTDPDARVGSGRAVWMIGPA
jgi:hypothetical protein